MIEQILPQLYRIEIPLPNNPLRSLNAYFVRGKERSLIIDTGMNLDECLKVMRSGLNELKVDLHKTDFFITHRHADHTGLLNELASKQSRVYVGDPEAIADLRDSEKKEAKYQIPLTYLGTWVSDRGSLFPLPRNGLPWARPWPTFSIWKPRARYGLKKRTEKSGMR